MVKIDSEEAYCKTVDEFADMVFRIAYQNLLNKFDAEDVTQDVFEKLLINKDKPFLGKQHLKAWLIRVTVNRCTDIKKSSHRNREVALDEANVPDRSEGKKEDLTNELLQLEEIDRNIIYLYYYEGYKIKEIAKLLGEKQNTVNSRLTRARKKLKRILEDGDMQ